MAEADRLKINETLCRHAPRLEALAEQQSWIASLDEDGKRLETELAGLTSQQKASGGELRLFPSLLRRKSLRRFERWARNWPDCEGAPKPLRKK